MEPSDIECVVEKEILVRNAVICQERAGVCACLIGTSVRIRVTESSGSVVWDRNHATSVVFELGVSADKTRHEDSPETGCPSAIQKRISETDTTCAQERELAHRDECLATITSEPGIARTVTPCRAENVIDIAEIRLIR